MSVIPSDVLDESVNPPCLIGGRNPETGKYIFPYPEGPEAEDYDRVELSRTGTLWSYTVQRFPPGPPYLGVTDRAKFEPFGVGYIELPDQIIVEAHLVVDDFSNLKVGLPMELTTRDFPRGDGDGTVRTFAFKPT